MPQAICDVVSGIGIGAAAADSIGYRAPARYRSNPSYKRKWKVNTSLMYNAQLHMYTYKQWLGDVEAHDIHETRRINNITESTTQKFNVVING